MMDHLGISVADMAASSSFYDTVLAPLGFSRQQDFGVAIGYGPDDVKPDFWISGTSEAPSNRETHVAFMAADRAAVQAFFDAAQAGGAEVLHAPREWPEYHEGYFAAFVRDPDGNNVEAVVHH